MDDPVDEEWPPRAVRIVAIRTRAESHFERSEYFAAASALAEAFDLARSAEREELLGLHHLAAAGYRHQVGDTERAARQLAHARRRLAAFPTHAEQIDAVERLLAS
jgi:hypothetical protein